MSGILKNVVSSVLEGSGNVGSGIIKLRLIDSSKVINSISKMLLDDEQIIYAFQAARDQVLFTNFRIIVINVKGLVGKKKLYTSMPYSKITSFSVQTVGFIELIPDQELFLTFVSGEAVRYDFSDSVDISSICRIIASFSCNCIK